MHHIYHTTALVLDSIPSKDTNSVLLVYTKELGLLYVVAHGVRSHESKLRYILQVGSRISLDLVKGKEMWQVTSASRIDSFDILLRSKITRGMWVRTVTIIKKLIPQDESDEMTWNMLLSFFETAYLLEEQDTFNPYLEIYLLHTLLGHLGYVTVTLNFIPSIEHIKETITQNSFPKKTYVQAINTALRNTHLV